MPTVRKFTAPDLEQLIVASGFTIEQSLIWDENHHVQWIVARKTG